MRDYFVPPDFSVRWYERTQKFHIFNKARTILWSFAPCFSFGSFLQNPLSNSGRFCRKLSNDRNIFLGDLHFLTEIGEKAKTSFNPVKGLYLARAPQFC